MKDAFVGIDVAFAKGKRLPVSFCTWEADRLVPVALRGVPFEPPRGSGNVATLNPKTSRVFAADTARYLSGVATHLGLRVRRIAIDAPSAPRSEGRRRRAAEVAMDRAGISCFTTPTGSEFEAIRAKVRRHLEHGGPENRLPHANQLWMQVGFQIFERLAGVAECLEVFPQATARVLGSGDVHKFKKGGVDAQLAEASRYTGWPTDDPSDIPFERIAFGPSHDRLDAYLSAWVAALDEVDRLPFGSPPDDVIWTPRLGTVSFPQTTRRARAEKRTRRASVTAAPSSQHQRDCPACGEHRFRRWPFGWDAHAAYRCSGLSAATPEARKLEFKGRFASLFVGAKT